MRSHPVNGSYFFKLEDLYFKACIAQTRDGILFRCCPRLTASLEKPDEVVVKVSPITEYSKNEVDALWSLNHPNIIKFRGFVEGDKQIYLITEYAPGGDLSQYIHRRGPLSESMGKRVMLQIAEGVHFIHSSGLAHRDLKLENFTIMEEIKSPEDFSTAHIKIVDFEFSIQCTPDTVCHETVGTRGYISPQGKLRQYNPIKADIWSLGISLFVLLTSEHPHFIDSIDEHCGHQPILPESFSPQLGDLLRKLLRCDEAKRFSSQDLLDHDWFDEVIDTGHYIMKTFRSFFQGSKRDSPTKRTKPNRECTAW